ncbi:MAG: D-2-hydroxyacid dehydrogenase [Rhodospirillaceae bacterium]|nr:D-2-hydroxyacid dehydrogenase [Rhodospirillaceae bacterium]
MTDRKLRVHIKNNHASPDTFPNTPEGEAVFTITRERFDAVARDYPDVASRLDVFIDWDTENFASSMKTADVLVTWDLPTENLASVAPNLRWIHIIGAGVEHLCPMGWLPASVTLVNNKGAHAAKAGEFGVMAIFMLHNRMPGIVENQKTRRWESLYSTPIAGKTVLVIGVGSIGGAVARLIKAYDVTVIGVSRHGRPTPGVDRMVATAELDSVLPLADYVFMATPLTGETRGLMDRRRLALMKPGSGIVNVGREGVMDYAALAEQLRRGHLSGAILDVFDPEPLAPESPLWQTPNLIVTPHVSADDGDSYVAITLKLFFDNMRRHLNGEPLRNVVDSKLGY